VAFWERLTRAFQRWQKAKIYETKQAAVCDCGHDYKTHEKSLRGKLICVYEGSSKDFKMRWGAASQIRATLGLLLFKKG